MKISSRWSCIVAGLALGIPFSGISAPVAAASVENGARDVQFAPDAFGGYASDRILIKVQPGVHVNLNADGSATISPHIDAAMTQWNVTGVRTAVRNSPRFVESAQRIGLDRWFILEVPSGTDTPTMARQFDAFASVEISEIAGVGGTAGVPNDPSFDLLYGMHNIGQVILGQPGLADADIDAPEAWDIFTGDPNVTIAIIDSGVDNHPDFTGRLMPGYNSVNGGTDSSDACPHGTHVAGTVGAAGDNGVGVAGVHWTVNLLPVRVLTGCGGTTDQCADGIIWAVDNGADVGTMSLQYYSFSQYFEDSTEYARDNNVLLVAANGNNFGRRVAWPAAFDWVVGVSATNNQDNLAWFSNYGPECEVAAPGEDVYSTWVANGYTYLSGTSMAAPHTSGLACLIWSFSPSLTAQEVRDILTSSVDDLGDPGWDERYGHGRINAALALGAAGGRMDLTVPPLFGGSQATISVTDANPNETVYFVYSLNGPGNTFVPQLNVTLEIANPVLAGSSTANAAGEASYTSTLPNVSNIVLWIQAAQFELTSNVVLTQIN